MRLRGGRALHSKEFQLFRGAGSAEPNAGSRGVTSDPSLNIPSDGLDQGRSDVSVCAASRGGSLKPGLLVPLPECLTREVWAGPGKLRSNEVPGAAAAAAGLGEAL